MVATLEDGTLVGAYSSVPYGSVAGWHYDAAAFLFRSSPFGDSLSFYSQIGNQISKIIYLGPGHGPWLGVGDFGISFGPLTFTSRSHSFEPMNMPYQSNIIDLEVWSVT